MALKKKDKEVPPAVVSSEEESEVESTDEEQEEEEQVDQEEEEEDEKEEADEDEDGEEETEGSSDSEEAASDSPAAMPKKSAAPPAVMPTPASTPPKATSSVSKPNSPAAKRKKSAKSAAPAPTPPIADSPAAKRKKSAAPASTPPKATSSVPIADSPPAEPTSRVSKRTAAEALGEEEDTKKKLLWSDEDQLTILNGMIDFKDKTGLDPSSSSNAAAFHEFLKNNLEAQVEAKQLSYKVAKLKGKFMSVSKNGNAPVFTKPYDSKSFELSMKIWGGVSESGKSAKKASGNLRASSSSAIKGNLRSSSSAQQQDVGEVMANVDETNYPRMMSSLRRSFPDLADRDLFRYIGHAKAKEFEGMWEKLGEETVDLCMLQHNLSIKKLNLENAQMKCLKEKEKD